MINELHIAHVDYTITFGFVFVFNFVVCIRLSLVNSLLLGISGKFFV